MENKQQASGENGDFWKQYVPNMPSNQPNQQQFNTGDRRPGSLGGPCGKTNYHDFGPCNDKKLHCEGMTSGKPGLCELDPQSTIEISRLSAMHAIVVADEVAASLKAAAIELLVAASPRTSINKVEKTETRTGAEPESDSSLTLNESILNLDEYSTSTVVVVMVGFAAIGYFCCIRIQKRRSYKAINDGWGGSASDRA
jgi:hypothetical protein